MKVRQARQFGLRTIAVISLLGLVLPTPLAWALDDGGTSKEAVPSGVFCCVNPDACCAANRNCGFYAGILVGGAVSANDPIVQSGTAFITPPLAVRASGDAKSRAGVMAGLHLGYQWGEPTVAGDSDWRILPAVEFEAYYLGTRQAGLLNNPTDRLPEHLFDYRAPLDIAVLMPNLLLTLHTPYRIHPYVGVGVGAALVSNHGVTSLQLSPPEPGINHFNSDPNASDWAIAATCRAGLRFDLGDSWYLFTEYKFLAIGATDYTFGSTVYPIHPPTSAWSVHYGTMFEHMGVLGLGCRF
ncbi:MAG: porin family protein [Gemmataceae bacterium]|nr:porin family protein [Gemmataceae bacterium]MDW8266487.1 hypothetical protein [Gemmataceae bacterium]